MAEIVASFLGPAIEAINWVAAPVVRQFNYLCCFNSNINNLKHEAEKLDDAVGGLQGQVDREKDNVQVIVPEVEIWLSKSNYIKDQKNTILNQVPNGGSGCLNLRARFSLSKRAKKTTDRMKEHRKDCNFNTISHPKPPAAMKAIPLGTTYEFESRKQIEEDIMTTLRSGDFNMIGICGMGGLGKTTMAKKIMNRVLEEQLFQEVVMVVVTQQVDNSKIQVEIGGSLGLYLRDDTSQARLQKLHARLTGLKTILLVLDDVWEGVELENLGIPCGHKRCKILLTSRNSDVLWAMNVQKIFGMEVLSEEDSWFLFREKVGNCVDDTKLRYIAKEVVKECSGLPIALTTVGPTLKDERNTSIWKDALRQLRQCDVDIPNFIAKVYNPLKLSYDFLGSKHAKSLFLLCCLFPEDADISLEYLTHFCLGLGIFEGIRNLEGARNRMFALTKMLKSRYLLLDSYDEDHVRIHDVVRDVCIFIAKHEGYIGGSGCTWISSFELVRVRSELSIGLGFPNLRLLFLNGNYYSGEEEFKFDNGFLERIRDLHVLCIENYSLTSLPHTTHSLKNLNILLLYSCRGLKTISVVGELVNLEILMCRRCNWIEELPHEIKGLSRLKLLELTGCRKLQSIGRGILSSLVGLEELKMRDSFNKWEAHNRKERKNVGLRELEALNNLTCLEIDIEDPALAAEKMHLSPKMERFHIIFYASYSLPSGFICHLSDKKICLRLEGETSLGHWIEMQLLRDAKCLYLCGNDANNLDLAKSQNIRWLMLGESESMKNIVKTSGGDDTVFPLIEHLELFSLPELEEICNGPISSCSFQNLKELELIDLAALKQFWKSSSLHQNNYVPLFTNLSCIYISRCPRLRNLSQLSIAGKDCLLQLEVLFIKECEMMEQVFSWNGEEKNRSNSESQNRHMITMKFPKLKKVELSCLPNLTTFYQGIKGIEFPLLTLLSIEQCPKMKRIRSNQNSGDTSSSADIDDESSHLFCQPQKVSFGNLKELLMDQNPFRGHKTSLSLFDGLEVLTITKCRESMSLFTFSMAGNLVSLRVLSIFHCDEMVKVIEDEEKVVSGGDRALIFPNLQKLSLEALPKLVSFCEWKCDVELPSLRQVVIRRCPRMKNLSLGFVAAPNLEAFTTDLNNYFEVLVNVSFDSLKELSIGGNENPFYLREISASLFSGLEKLTFSWCHRSVSLFTSSMAGNLVNMKVLDISDCDEMVKVIEDGEEGNVVSERTVLFPKLEVLSLYSLNNLESFCEWKCDVELPSLERLDIMHCPNMKSFTLGPLTTPNLKFIRINYEDFGAEKDLNGVLQQHLARAKEKQEENKEDEEGGEEDQEAKGEIRRSKIDSSSTIHFMW